MWLHPPWRDAYCRSGPDAGGQTATHVSTVSYHLQPIRIYRVKFDSNCISSLNWSDWSQLRCLLLVWFPAVSVFQQDVGPSAVTLCHEFKSI